MLTIWLCRVVGIVYLGMAAYAQMEDLSDADFWGPLVLSTVLLLHADRLDRGGPC